MSNYKEMIKAIGPAEKMNGDTNNCAVLALAAAFEIPYDVADEWIEKNWNRRRLRGTSTGNIVKSFSEMKELFGKQVLSKSNKNQYVYKRTGKVVECAFKLGNFAKTFKKGTFYVLIRKHATVVKDGVIMDSSKAGAIVNYVWKIK
jgi:hypothetical protein